MAFNNGFTAVTGATYTAAQYNTYVRDNFSAIWVGTTAGDLNYYSSATAKSRLAIGAANYILTSSGTAPQWSAPSALNYIPGLLHAKGKIDFAPVFSFTGGMTDISGATVTLTLTRTCTILVMASVVGYNATTGRTFYYRAVVDGTADPTPVYSSNGGEARNEALPYIYYATGIASGSRIVKLQCSADTDPNWVERGKLIALAFTE